jgi:DNA repair exonuclease SbcCD ATPase subunit
MELVEAWLRENFFRHDPESATIWKRDPIATRDRLLQEKEKENQDLLNANNQLHTCNEVVLSENKSLAADIERLSAHLEELSGRLINAETELQRLTTEVDSTRAENQNLQQDNDQKAHEITMLHESLHTKTALIAVMRDALRQLFPVDTYKRDNVDLSELDEEQLAIHYLEHGRKEGRLKTYQELDDALRLSNIRSEETESKLNLMASNYDLLKQQLETIKDLFARLAEDPHSQKKDKDNHRE